MKTTSYGAWVKEYREGQEFWYPQGDTSFLPLELDIVDFDFYVDGEHRNHFRIVSDGTLPCDLEVWDNAKAIYRSCAVCYVSNVWDRLFTTRS